MTHLMIVDQCVWRGPTVKPTILIVDDHDAFRSSLRGWLNVEFPQYAILEAPSGEDVVALARDTPPMLVVMDLHLPKMNGIEATHAIKAFMPDVKVVILSIYEDQVYHTDATAAGVNAYIPKRKIRTDLLPTIAMLLKACNDDNDQNEYPGTRKKKKTIGKSCWLKMSRSSVWSVNTKSAPWDLDIPVVRTPPPL
jgi:CheY-like chemotaxis protein